MKWKLFGLAILWALPSLFPTAFAIYFHIHQQEWSKTICINRNLPNNCCQAKCQWENKVAGISTSESNHAEIPAIPIFITDSDFSHSIPIGKPENICGLLAPNIDILVLKDIWIRVPTHPPELV